MSHSTEATVTPIRPTAAPPVFVAVDREGDLPGTGEYMVRLLDGRVTLAYRDHPWDSWGRPVVAEIRS